MAQAAALVAAAACDHCGGSLAHDAETDAAFQTVCGACIEANWDAARDALYAAIAADHAREVRERAPLAA